MRRHELMDKRNAQVTKEFSSREEAEAYLEKCEDQLLTCRLVQVGNKWRVEIEK